jgi:hypothetical protein
MQGVMSFKFLNTATSYHLGIVFNQFFLINHIPPTSTFALCLVVHAPTLFYSSLWWSVEGEIRLFPPSISSCELNNFCYKITSNNLHPVFTLSF